MFWSEVECHTIDDLLSHLVSYDSGWLFRGQSRESWELSPTLERTLGSGGWNPGMAKKCEDYSMHVFRSKAHHYLSRDLLPTTKLGWLSLMQHHGVPTRLLDFTESPFIALFFALDGISVDQDERCALWALEYRSLMKSAVNKLEQSEESFNLGYSEVQMKPDEIFDEFVEECEHEMLWVTEPRLFNLRLERQKGTFLLSTNVSRRIQDLLPLEQPPEKVRKILIPASLANGVFRLLRSMGIDHAKLFGDIDGLAKDVKNEMSYQVAQSVADG